MRNNHFNIEKIKGGSVTPTVIETDFHVDNRIPLTEQVLEVTACYDYFGATNQMTGLVRKDVPISFEAYCYLVAAVKEADFKLTLEANSQIPPLNEVFKEFIDASSPDPSYYENPNVLSFLLNEGSICTVIVAKNSSNIG